MTIPLHYNRYYAAHPNEMYYRLEKPFLNVKLALEVIPKWTARQWEDFQSLEWHASLKVMKLALSILFALPSFLLAGVALAVESIARKKISEREFVSKAKLWDKIMCKRCFDRDKFIAKMIATKVDGSLFPFSKVMIVHLSKNASFNLFTPGGPYSTFPLEIEPELKLDRKCLVILFTEPTEHQFIFQKIGLLGKSQQDHDTSIKNYFFQCQFSQESVLDLRFFKEKYLSNVPNIWLESWDQIGPVMHAFSLIKK